MSKKKRAAKPLAQPAAPQPVQPSAQRQAVYEEPPLNWGRLTPAILLCAAYFLLLGLSVPSVIKGLALVVMAVTIVVLLVRAKQLAGRMSWLVLAVLAWTTLNGISTLYAVSGKFALYEFLKVMVAFGVFVLILAFGQGDPRELGRRSAAVLSCGAALASLFSIDFISTRVLSTLFFWTMGMFSQDYAGLPGIEAGVRMTSIFENPNIFAGCAGIGVLLALGLATTARGRRERRFHLVCLAISSLAFLLAFSMGASGMIALAFLVYLLLERPERRAGLIVVMVETLVLAVAAAFPIYLTAFDAWIDFQPIPLLCTAAMAAALCLLDHYVGRRVTEKLSGSGKAVFALVGAVLAVVAVYAAAAVNVTGSAHLAPGEFLRRSDYPDPGSYTLAVQSSAPLSVTIESQNRQDTMMHTSTVLYEGPAQDAAFQVPEDSMVVYFNFQAGQDTLFSAATYQGEGGSGSLKLGYKLLPGFVANRLQGLFANQNAIQRTVFFEDGIKLFYRSPIIGLGMGAFENSLASVQSFYYTTKYAHNHYIQAMVETGVIGLLLFLSVLLLSAWAVLRARKREDASPLTASLGAALAFMAGHAAVEVVFSSNFYLPFAYGVFALIALCCGGFLPPLPLKEKVRRYTAWGAAVLVGIYLVLLNCNLYARQLYNQPYYESLEKAIVFDRFEWADYMLSYAYSASAEEQPGYETEQTLARYLDRLEKLDSNTVPRYLAECYFNLGRLDKAFAMLERYVSYVASDQTAWQNAFQIVMENGQDSAEYRQGVVHLYQLMQDWNEQNMGSVALDPMAQAFAEYIVSQEAQ